MKNQFHFGMEISNLAHTINKEYIKKNTPIKPLAYYVDGLILGNKYILSEAITLLESDHVDKKNLAYSLLNYLYTYRKCIENKSIKIAVTGSPGVGKSTFIESLGLHLTSLGHKVAVLAIDPTSLLYAGSIMGDKTRMEALSKHDMAYIRPSSNNTDLGGVHEATIDATFLCEAAGYDYILIETVGIGQSEYHGSIMADITMLLVQPLTGDDVQAVKKGILELADIIIINKINMPSAQSTVQFFKEATSFYRDKYDGVKRTLFATEALDGIGIPEVAQGIFHLVAELKNKNIFDQIKKIQNAFWYEQKVKKMIEDILMNDKKIAQLFSQELKNINTQDAHKFKSLNKVIDYIKERLNE
jgi:LAO/AO transport system kinase